MSVMTRVRVSSLSRSHVCLFWVISHVTARFSKKRETLTAHSLSLNKNLLYPCFMFWFYYFPYRLTFWLFMSRDSRLPERPVYCPRRALKPEEATTEGCAYIYRMYLQSEYRVCIADKISICSNRGRMESLGNDDVSLQNAHKYLAGNDCDVTITGGSSK